MLAVSGFIQYKRIHNEAVTTNREIVADHLAYTQVYMFLVAGKHGQRRKDERE